MVSRMKEWVSLARDQRASDVHLESGTPLVLRIRGELTSVGEKIPGELVAYAAKELLSADQWQEFLYRRSADLSKTISGTRCRINLFHTIRGIGMAIRILSSFQNNLNDCNLHPDLKRLVASRSGLVILSGATGSGKSTTLAALIEELNIAQKRHIITIENPIEYFYTNKKSFIRQREVPTHTPTFEQGIIDSMRENPDVLVIGEMRTPDVMRLTLNAAETGHLVLATMHSSTCSEALARLCMSFPAELQGSIRSQLADSLVGVVCQRLNYLPQYQIQVPQCEILMASSAAKSNIRAGQFSQIVSVIQTGGEEGSWSFERYQKWIEQRPNWIKPSQAAPLEVKDGDLDTSTASLDRPLSKQPMPTRALPPALRSQQTRPQPNVRLSDENRIEISSVDEDLEELAKKLLKSEGGPDEG
jgi:twitching motility protein PilT